MRVIKTGAGKCAAMTCGECCAEGIACVAVGEGQASALICTKCAHEAYMALCEARGISARIKEGPARHET